jgi:hypothetical protein
MTTLFSLFCPLLSFLLCPCTLIVCVCVCVCMCAERDRAQTESSEQRRQSEGQANAHTREREQKGQDSTRMKRTQKKTHYNQTADYLTLYRWSSFERWLVMVTAFSSLLPSSHCISRSLSFAQHATSGLSSRAALLTLLAPTPFFSLFFLSPLCKKTINGGTQ